MVYRYTADIERGGHRQCELSTFGLVLVRIPRCPLSEAVTIVQERWSNMKSEQVVDWSCSSNVSGLRFGPFSFTSKAVRLLLSFKERAAAVVVVKVVTDG